MNDDAALLRRYAEEKSESAFAELVRRHLDLVHSAALRRLGGDTHQAADVAQHVFTTLARDAAKLSEHAVLTAWLYTATRNAATDLIRSDQRRRRREQKATLMQHQPDPPVSGNEWEKLRPVLDEVMDELPEADRTAVLLRFFEKRGLADIGVVLGMSEDAARMRVSRALDKLRALLDRRGIKSTSSALATVFAQQVTAAAPAGLAASISTAALASNAAIAAATGTKFAAITFMTTAKSISWVASTVAIFALVYSGFQYREARLREREASTLKWEGDRLHEGEKHKKSAELRNAGSGKTQRDDEVLQAADGLDFTDPVVFREMLLSMPGQSIPELQLLSDEMWELAASFSTGPEGVLKAFQTVRGYAKVNFAALARDAIAKYASANEGRLPAQLGELKPYFARPIDLSILQRYSLLQRGLLDEVPRSVPVLGETAGVQSFYDSVIRISPSGSSIMNYYGYGAEIERGINRFIAQSSTRLIQNAQDIRPYVDMAVPTSAIQAHIAQFHRTGGPITTANVGVTR